MSEGWELLVKESHRCLLEPPVERQWPHSPGCPQRLCKPVLGSICVGGRFPPQPLASKEVLVTLKLY